VTGQAGDRSRLSGGSMVVAWRRWHDALTELGAKVAALGVGLIALVYTAEVVARYFFSAPLNWSGDLSSYLLCAIAFLGFPRITRDGAHIAVSVAADLIGEGRRDAYAYGLSLVTGVACLITAAFVADEGLRLYQANVLTSQATQIPRWIMAAVVFYGFFSSALHLLTGDVGAAERDRGS
jgi:TRAP-type C4-dicarboxylate transport system permease small subunit